MYNNERDKEEIFSKVLRVGKKTIFSMLGKLKQVITI